MYVTGFFRFFGSITLQKCCQIIKLIIRHTVYSNWKSYHSVMFKLKFECLECPEITRLIRHIWKVKGYSKKTVFVILN